MLSISVSEQQSQSRLRPKTSNTVGRSRFVVFVIVNYYLILCPFCYTSRKPSEGNICTRLDKELDTRCACARMRILVSLISIAPQNAVADPYREPSRSDPVVAFCSTVTRITKLEIVLNRIDRSPKICDAVFLTDLPLSDLALIMSCRN